MLAEEKTLHFADTADKGGPLGELVQWCDLITSLHILGHDIKVTVEHPEMIRYECTGHHQMDQETRQQCDDICKFFFQTCLFLVGHPLLLLVLQLFEAGGCVATRQLTIFMMD